MALGRERLTKSQALEIVKYRQDRNYASYSGFHMYVQVSNMMGYESISHRIASEDCWRCR